MRNFKNKKAQYEKSIWCNRLQYLNTGLVIILIIMSSCNSKQTNANKSALEDKSIELISACNNSLNSSEDILDYAPNNIKNDKTLSKYISDSYESFCITIEKSYVFLDNIAEFKNDSIEIQKIDNNNALSVAKGFLKVGKTLAKGAYKGSSLLISASGFAFDYKSKFEEFKKTYSDNQIDSLRHMIHYVSLFNVLNDECLALETSRIKKFESIRSTVKIPVDIIDDAGLNSNLESFKKLNNESNKVIKILLLNKMNGVECSNIEDEVVRLTNYFEGSDSDYKPHLKILEDYSNALLELKNKLNESKSFIEKNKTKYNVDMINSLNKIMKQYNTDITLNITNLNVYKNIPSANEKLQKEIKKGSDIYFE